MRLNTLSDVQTGGHVEEEQNYSIEFSPFMASLLSDKLLVPYGVNCTLMPTTRPTTHVTPSR